MMDYKYYFADGDGDGFFHRNHLCDRLDGLSGDMTDIEAIRATADETDLDPCPECVL